MIDWDRLTRLRSEIGDEDFAEVAEMFVVEIGEALARLAARPGTATAEDFHFLRGSAANLGFAGFADACSAAESAVDGGRPVDLPALAALFEASLAETANALGLEGKAA